MKKELELYLINNQVDFYRLAFSYVKNHDDALDIVQDSVCKAIKAHSSFKHHSSINTWFYRIIVNTSLDFIKKKQNIIDLEDDVLDILNSETDVYENIDLKYAIEKLPIKYKTVITLRYFEDFELKEIAYILNEPLSTIKTRLYQAQKKLKITLTSEERMSR